MPDRSSFITPDPKAKVTSSGGSPTFTYSRAEKWSPETVSVDPAGAVTLEDDSQQYRYGVMYNWHSGTTLQVQALVENKTSFQLESAYPIGTELGFRLTTTP